MSTVDYRRDQAAFGGTPVICICISALHKVVGLSEDSLLPSPGRFSPAECKISLPESADAGAQRSVQRNRFLPCVFSLAGRVRDCPCGCRAAAPRGRPAIPQRHGTLVRCRPFHRGMPVWLSILRPLRTMGRPVECSGFWSDVRVHSLTGEVENAPPSSSR